MSPLAAGAGAEGVWESAFSRSPPCGLFTCSKNRARARREVDRLCFTPPLVAQSGRQGERAEDQPAHKVHFKLFPDFFCNLC